MKNFIYAVATATYRDSILLQIVQKSDTSHSYDPSSGEPPGRPLYFQGWYEMNRYWRHLANMGYSSEG